MVLSAMAPMEAAIAAQNLSIAEWMERNITFGPDRPRPGRLVLDDWQRPILYSMQHTPETVLEIYSQGGKSLKLLGGLGWVCETGKTAMMAFPTDVLRERFRSRKLEPLLEDCPRMDALIKRTAKGDLGKEELERHRGLPVPLAVSGGKGALQQIDSEFTFADEIDQFQLTKESNDPMAILRGRGRAYRERARLIIASTPTTRDASLVDAHFRASCGFRRYAICPMCEGLTLLVFDPEKPDRLTCQCCERMIPFDAQREILPTGMWIPDRPSLVGEKDGYHLNQFWDALTPWQSILQDYDPDKPRDFFVQQMAIPASNLAEEPLEDAEVDALFQAVPEEWPQVAKVMTVDVQRRRGGELVYSLWTIHDSMRRPALVCRWQRVITKGAREWLPAFRDLRKEYLAAKPACMFIDAGDAHGCDVQEMVRAVFRSELRTGRVRPIKGWAHVDSRKWGGEPFIKTEETIRTKVKKLDRPLEINSPSCKSRFIELMRRQRVILPGRRGVDYPTNIVQQFTAEILRSYVGIGGVERLRWAKLPGRENEALDNGTYALAATAYLGPAFGGKRRVRSGNGVCARWGDVKSPAVWRGWPSQRRALVQIHVPIA